MLSCCSRVVLVVFRDRLTEFDPPRTDFERRVYRIGFKKKTLSECSIACSNLNSDIKGLVFKHSNVNGMRYGVLESENTLSLNSWSHQNAKKLCHKVNKLI